MKGGLDTAFLFCFDEMQTNVCKKPCNQEHLFV